MMSRRKALPIHTILLTFCLLIPVNSFSSRLSRHISLYADPIMGTFKLSSPLPLRRVAMHQSFEDADNDNGMDDKYSMAESATPNKDVIGNDDMAAGSGVVDIEKWVQENQVLAAVPILLGGVLLVTAFGSIAATLFPSTPDAMLIPSNVVSTSVPRAVSGSAVSGSIASSTFDPRNFQPVCGVSDAVYRTLQASALSVVGKQNYEDYAPLIAGGILRVRLELCVLESFVYEAVLPFVKEKGLSWVLPLHETVETFLAGTVFAIATNFILLGSTKIVAVLVAYTDLLFGLPARLLGSLGWNVSYRQLVGPESGKQKRGEKLDSVEQFQKVLGTTNVATNPFILLFGFSTILRLFGGVAKNGRKVLELLDTFVGRYLVYTTVGYVTLKFLHFKVFPDFPF